MAKVTIGMPAYNRAKVLAETIHQILNQTFTDFELIIYNDGSTDDTVKIINSFNDPRIILIDRPNLGPPHPLNAIYAQARGEYVIILHDHDFFHPTLVEKSVAALDRHKSAGFVLQGSAWIDEDGVSHYREMLHDLPVINKGRALGESMLLHKTSFSSIFHACCMVRRSALEQVGMGYSPEFGLYADTDLWLRLLFSFDFIYLKEVLFKFRTRETVGHFLSNRQFEIQDWQFNIQRTNAERYFGSDLEKEKYVQKIIAKKHNAAQREIFLRSIAIRNEHLFQEGLIELKKNSNQPLTIVWCSRMATLYPVKYVLWQIIPLLNKWRKKLK